MSLFKSFGDKQSRKNAKEEYTPELDDFFKKRNTSDSSIKHWQRVALEPLYEKQADYLTRMIKTLEIDPREIMSRMDEYKKNAICHEVALNNLAGTSIETIKTRSELKRNTQIIPPHLALEGIGE